MRKEEKVQTISHIPLTCSGTLELPVTNWSSLALISSEYPSTICQNQITTWESALQCFRRVWERQSVMSILPIPPETTER